MDFSCQSFRRAGITRRRMLHAGLTGMMGLSLPRLLQGTAVNNYSTERPKVRAKSVIFLFQWGGPSHLETFDMKPDAPEKFRGPHKPMRSACPDIDVNERLPQVARIMDKVSVIRTVHHKMTNHNSAGYYALTGKSPASDDQRLRESIELFPGYGSVADRLLPDKDPSVPAYVSYPCMIADGAVTPGQFASFLGKKHDPLYIPSDPNDPAFNLPQFSLPAGLSLDRLQHRRGLQQFIDQQSRLIDYSAEAAGLDEYYVRALAMLQSPRVREAFNIAAETDKMRERYGRTPYGQGCLLARRLVENGVRFVTNYFDESIGGQSTSKGGWDTHGFNNTRMFPIIEERHLPITDQTLPALLQDLEQRGMLDETLVVWFGEFGRTPEINKSISRDHWPHCYSVLMAGGGVKRGFVHGKSDETGSRPAENPVTPDDVAATIFYLMGIDPRSEIYDAQSRPIMISSGNPVMEVVA